MREREETYTTSNSAEIIRNDVKTKTRPLYVQTVIHSVSTVIVFHLLSLFDFVRSYFKHLRVRR